MRLTNEQINQAAAELLGIEWQKYDNYGIRNPDFINDANAVRELVRWLIGTENAKSNDDFHEFLDRETAVISPLFTIWLPPKHITLAVLYATGKITEQQAKEAMSDEL